MGECGVGGTVKKVTGRVSGEKETKPRNPIIMNSYSFLYGVRIGKEKREQMMKMNKWFPNRSKIHTRACCCRRRI